MERRELKDFYNGGFGWICKHCERALESSVSVSKQSRLMREGEAESKLPRFSNVALAKWTDDSHQTLICPRCGVTERVE